MALPAVPLPRVAAELPGAQHRRYWAQRRRREEGKACWRVGCGGVSDSGDPGRHLCLGIGGEARRAGAGVATRPGEKGLLLLDTEVWLFSAHPPQAATTAPRTSTSITTRGCACRAVSSVHCPRTPHAPAQSSQLLTKPLASLPAPPLPRGTARDQGSQRHRERDWPSPPFPSPNIHSPSLQPQGTPRPRQPAGVCGCRAGTSWEFSSRRPGGHWTLPAATLGQHPGWPLHSLPGHRCRGGRRGEKTGSRGPGTSAVAPSPVSSASHPGDTAEGSEGPRQAETGRGGSTPNRPSSCGVITHRAAAHGR